MSGIEWLERESKCKQVPNASTSKSSGFLPWISNQFHRRTTISAPPQAMTTYFKPMTMSSRRLKNWQKLNERREDWGKIIQQRILWFEVWANRFQTVISIRLHLTSSVLFPISFFTVYLLLRSTLIYRLHINRKKARDWRLRRSKNMKPGTESVVRKVL